MMEERRKKEAAWELLTSGLFAPPFGASVPGGGIVYLLDDEFTTDAAASFASPALSEPGPGKLVRAADSASRVSKDAGDLLWSGAAASANVDPAYYFTDSADASFTRAAGLTAIFKLISTGVMNFGFTTNTTIANATMFGFLSNSGTSLSYTRAGNTVVIGSFSAATTYLLAATLRTNGIEFRIKGGAYSEWSTIFVETNWSTTPVWPAITQSGSVTSRFPFVRIPLLADVGKLATGSHILSQDAPDTTILTASNSALFLLTATSVAGAGGNLIEVRTQQADANNYMLARIQWNGSNYELVTGHVIAGVETLQGAPIATVFGTSGVNRLWIRDVGTAHDFFSTGGTTISKRYATITDASGGANVGTSVRIVGGFTSVNLTAWDYNDAAIAAILDRLSA